MDKWSAVILEGPAAREGEGSLCFRKEGGIVWSKRGESGVQNMRVEWFMKWEEKEGGRVKRGENGVLDRRCGGVKQRRGCFFEMAWECRAEDSMWVCIRRVGVF